MTNKGNDEWFESEQSGGDQFVNIDDISTENTTTFNNSPTGVRQNNNANQEALFPGLQSNMAVGLAKSVRRKLNFLNMLDARQRWYPNEGTRLVFIFIFETLF
jgi:hypothetical protein